jgi:hypothetical protein
MKIPQLPALRWLPSAVVILLTGCATQHPTISTWHNSPLTPTRADRFALTVQHNSSKETSEVGRLLTAELKWEGFNVVPVEQADYLMAYALEDELVQDQRHWITTTTPASPPQTTGQVMAQGPNSVYSVSPSIPGSIVMQPVVFRNRGVRLFCYSNPKTHPGGFQIVWQGYITAGPTTSTECETALIRTLLGYLGQEHHGSVNLAR